MHKIFQMVEHSIRGFKIPICTSAPSGRFLGLIDRAQGTGFKTGVAGFKLRRLTISKESFMENEYEIKEEKNKINQPEKKPDGK